jgi:Ser/Thr protein kinase RdoA (MazF antagonist)
MIPVPQSALEALARSYGTAANDLRHFGGGREDSDGVVYAYPHEQTQRLLKIMAIPLADQRRGLFGLDERLRFMRFLGERGAPITFPLRSPQDTLYETTRTDSHLWVGYSMDVAPGQTLRQGAWDADVFRDWGRVIGQLHRLAREYPTWETSVDPANGERCLHLREEWDGFYTWCQDDEVKRKWLDIRHRLDALPITREALGFIHNDPHLMNLLVDGNRITLLDFRLVAE